MKAKLAIALCMMIALTGVLAGCAKPTEKDIQITSIIVSTNGLTGFNAETEDGEAYVISLVVYGSEYMDARFQNAADVEFYMTEGGSIVFENVDDETGVPMSMKLSSVEGSNLVQIIAALGFTEFEVTHPDYEEQIPMTMNDEGQLALPDGTQIHMKYAGVERDFVVGQNIKIYMNSDEEWQLDPVEEE